MPIVMDNVWVATTNATTTTTDSFFIKADVQILAQEMKSMYKVVHEIKHTNEIVGTKTGRFGPEKKLQKKKRAKDLPLGAHMPNIHLAEIIWSKEFIVHAWCQKGNIASLFDPRRPSDFAGQMPVKGKPFCVVCKRFLSKGAVSNLKDCEADGLYVRQLVPTLGLGVVVMYYTGQNEEHDEDCAAEPPVAENSEW